MNWGKWIIVSFILFAAFIVTLVTVCVREDISLVSKDYYKEELAYQDQIVRIKNTSKLANPPTIKVINSGSLQIDYDHFNEMEKGELKLFRPSDPAMDRKFDIKPSTAPMQVVTMEETLSKGMYRARLQWSMHGEEFYIEEVIFI